MEIEDENGVVWTEKMFTRMSNKRRESELERTVEIYGLHPHTPEFRIKSAMSRRGEVEKITTRPCSKENQNHGASGFQQSGGCEEDPGFRNVVNICRKGTFTRLRKVGGEMIEWGLRYVSKLSCLPSGTTAMDLQSLLEKD
ncbi:hypothetical protein BGZ54_009872 [Gamsiella multidivaricata]|nr:hypothetical protein BGZ54_009872 [Gamsiella multidivaricata]